MSAQYSREWLTEKEIKNLVDERLKPYHEQNLEKFDQLFAAMNKLSGSFQTAAWIIGLIIAIVGLVIGVKTKL